MLSKIDKLIANILIFKIALRPSVRPSVRLSVHQRTGKGRKGQKRMTWRGKCWKKVEREELKILHVPPMDFHGLDPGRKTF